MYTCTISFIQYITPPCARITSLLHVHTLHHSSMSTHYITPPWAHITSLLHEHTLHHSSMCTKYITPPCAHILMWFVFPTPAVPVGECETSQARICVGMSSMYVIQAQLTLTPTLKFLFMSLCFLPPLHSYSCLYASYHYPYILIHVFMLLTTVL